MSNPQPARTYTTTISTIDAPGIRPMDPRLQKQIVFGRRGMRKPATASTAKDEIAVIARVSDVQAWESLSEVRPGVTVGDQGADGTTVVTARIPVSRIEHIRAQPFVKSLKAAQRLSRSLAATTQEMLARPGLLPPGAKAKGGQGVIVGIVDIGCDFAHRDFLSATGKTRLKHLWNQGGSGSGTGPFDYGTFYTPAEINAALKKPDPYTALGYGPESGEPAHGTHVMDIAAGNGRGSGVPGVAPGAELIFVEIASSDIPWGGTEAVGKNFGDSVQLLEALAFVFNQAGTKPCVINVSLGTNGGPHDGSTLVEQGIDRLVTQSPNRSVVIAASNSFSDGIHAAGTVPPGGQFDLPWMVAPGDFTENELELWYAHEAQLSVEIIAPDGTGLGTVPPNENATVADGGNVVLFAANRLNDPNNGDNMIGVFLNRGASGGRWIVRLKNGGTQAVGFHAWVERDDYGQSSFPEPLDNSHTIGSISCGHASIVVGSYDAHKPGVPLSYFSSAGPTRDGRQKPEVSAPGHGVQAAKSRSKTGVTRMSGTSMAAPAVTGAVALLLAEARARRQSLSSDQIRQTVANTARRNPPTGNAWDPRYGAGRVSANGLVASLAGVGPVSARPSAGARGKAKKAKARKGRGR